jgi:uncharacterized protein
MTARTDPTPSITCSVSDLKVGRGAGRALAGSLWLPAAGRPRAAVLMWPGSGSSDRNNDAYFPPIRDHLLDGGVAVAAFDKRGVGGSDGDWLEADISDQADDAHAIVERLRTLDQLLGVPIGLFGHSQGGWVVIETGACDDRLAFVVSNSGPGVTPAQQDRYATLRGAQRDGLTRGETDRLLADYDALGELLRGVEAPSDVRRLIAARASPPSRLRALARYASIPEDDREWTFMRRILDHDPAPALERITCPLLALFGSNDELAPVAESTAIYQDARKGRAGLTVHVFPGADHRCQVGDPPGMAPRYFELLLRWIVDVVD